MIMIGLVWSLNSLQDGSTALLVASQEGHFRVVRMLLEVKADINIKDNVSESCSSEIPSVAIIVCIS